MMVERFDHASRYYNDGWSPPVVSSFMIPQSIGQYVIYSDYAALSAKLAEAEALAVTIASQRDYAVKSNEVNFTRAEAAEARVAELEKALKRAQRVLTFPVDTRIHRRGYGLRTDDDSVGHAVEVLIAALAATKEPKP